MSSLPEIVDRMSVGAAWMAVAAFAGVGLLLGLDGLLEFVSHRSLPGASDLARVLALWGAFLPLSFLCSARRVWAPAHFAGPAGRRGGAQRGLKPGPRLVQGGVATTALVMVGLGFLHLGPATRDGAWSFFEALALPAGFALLAVQALVDTLLRSRVPRRSPSPGARP
ncbi:hypothetical protein GWI72_15340 [Microvirga tunisiensis]|uniref:Uncharacterized protein n=2 Tax=Pannonibacter tanglangensis TaxID=2750084 RepID=A0ABW9ZKZ9_9HYPH|nr:MULTISPECIES: hypothetical protein [unclassified Pannonibacter]NBN65373.1 hypothetical protein [Pannonibacter sp. XCT-34]NBN79650.1 hypothetical protein [Pannonibacter sp. XCT-53]